MPLLARFLQFLKWIEGLLEFVEFLTSPIGTAALFGMGCYVLLQCADFDALSAATLSGSLGLVAFCARVPPEF